MKRVKKTTERGADVIEIVTRLPVRGAPMTAKKAARPTMDSDGVEIVSMAADALERVLIALEDVRDIAQLGDIPGSDDFAEIMTPLRRARSLLRTGLSCHTEPRQ